MLEAERFDAGEENNVIDTVVPSPDSEAFGDGNGDGGEQRERLPSAERVYYTGPAQHFVALIDTPQLGLRLNREMTPFGSSSKVTKIVPGGAAARAGNHTCSSSLAHGQTSPRALCASEAKRTLLPS